MGIDVVARQSFFHGHYALLDDDMFPRPVCFLTCYILVTSLFLNSTSLCIAVIVVLL